MSSTVATLYAPTALRCAGLALPLGIDTPHPRLRWEVPLVRRGSAQTAYQVLVASSPALLQAGTGDLWDSGRVASPQSVDVPYAGQTLDARQRAYWAVRIWDEAGQVSPYSVPAWWEMGLLAERDWQAQWIGYPGIVELCDPAALPAPYFRTTFSVEQPVVAARAYLCGLGYHELYLNGVKVGDSVLEPGVTRYDARALYVVHDLTAQIAAGENAVGVVLGTGWYNCHTKDDWNFVKAAWRNQPRLLLQIELTLADGSTRTVGSHAGWKVSHDGPIRFDGLRNGETYDARLELPGWAAPGYDATAWPAAEVVSGPGGILTSELLPCRVMQTLTPVAVRALPGGDFLVDMGQNMAGWAQLRVSGPAGTEITLRYAERLTDDGNDISQDLINWAIKSGDIQTDRYILRGEGVEVWEPRFTYHGFQYVKISGFPGTPDLDALRGRVVHSAFADAGEFACSNGLLNAIQRNTRWSYISNFVGIPTDCPHREKNGWTGDALVAAETGLFNYAAAPAYRKWLRDIADAQRPSGQLPGIVPTGGWGYNWGNGPAWDSAYTHIPWYLYLYAGDSAVLAEHYAGMKRYVHYLTRMASDHLVTFGLGDWCSPTADNGNSTTCPTAITSTGYYYANSRLLARVAALLGHHEDAAYFTHLATQIKAAFNRAFYDAASGQYAGSDQTAQATALFHGMAPDGEEARVLENLIGRIAAKDHHLDFGILGAKYVLNALTACGRPEVAYAIATQTTFPSWGAWILQGASTLWESWSGDISQNHIMFGDISAWMFKTLAGINPDPDAPGFRHCTIHPYPLADLTWARGTHQTPYGELRSAWRLEEDCFMLEVRIPANSSATVVLPTTNADAVTESGCALTAVPDITRRPGTPVTLDVPAGEYCFVVAQPDRLVAQRG
jgi:alpha-L-rhamnosidase